MRNLRSKRNLRSNMTPLKGEKKARADLARNILLIESSVMLVAIFLKWADSIASSSRLALVNTITASVKVSWIH